MFWLMNHRFRNIVAVVGNVRLLVLIVIGLFLLLSVGCDSGGGGTICPLVAEPAVVVEVRNANTGKPEAEGAIGILVNGSYTDSMGIHAKNADGIPVSLAGGYERSGIYTVRIEKPGFQTWLKEEVYVERRECGPETEMLLAQLTPNT